MGQFLRQRPARECDHDADRAGDEQRRHDALPEDEQRDCGGNQHAELPGLAQCERQRDRGAEDRADRGRARTVEEARAPDGSRAAAGSARRRAG